MIYEIKHKSNGRIIFAGDFDSIKSCVEAATKADANLCDANLRGANLCDADLSDANLRGADLRGANLRGANLRRADLRGANLRRADLGNADLRRADLRGANLSDANLFSVTGDGAEIITIISKTYTINIIKPTATIQIGCERYAISEWLSFDDDAISAMDDGALGWWRVYKPIIIMHLKALDLLGNEGQ